MVLNITSSLYSNISYFSRAKDVVYEVSISDEHLEEDEDILNYDGLDDPDAFV